MKKLDCPQSPTQSLRIEKQRSFAEATKDASEKIHLALKPRVDINKYKIEVPVAKQIVFRASKKGPMSYSYLK